jgi:hypothetical protein
VKRQQLGSSPARNPPTKYDIHRWESLQSRNVSECRSAQEVRNLPLPLQLRTAHPHPSTSDRWCFHKISPSVVRGNISYRRWRVRLEDPHPEIPKLRLCTRIAIFNLSRARSRIIVRHGGALTRRWRLFPSDYALGGLGIILDFRKMILASIPNARWFIACCHCHP